MKLPVSLHHDKHGVMFTDSDDSTYSPQDVCFAVNNAAAGEWEKGLPFALFCDRYDEYLFMYFPSGHKMAFVGTYVVNFYKGEWVDIKGSVHSNPDMYAKINISKVEHVD